MNTTHSHRSTMDTLLRRERPNLVTYALKCNVLPQDAEDVAQEACMRFAATFDPNRDASMKTWLYSLMKSRIFEYHRTQSPFTRANHRKTSFTNFSDCGPQTMAAMGYDPTDEMTAGVEAAALWSDIMDRCSPRETELMQLLFTHDTDVERARAMNTSSSNVGQIRHHLQRKVAKILKARETVCA